MPASTMTSAGPSSSMGGSTSAVDAKRIVLSPETVSTFKPAKVFTSQVTRGTSITSLSYDDSGSYCVTSGEDNFCHVYDAKRGLHQHKLASLKYGVRLAHFTHDRDAVIHASTMENNAIRYLSIKTKTYIKYFEGHQNEVVTLDFNPQNDTFLSGSVDESIRLWDLRTPKSQGHLHLRGHPVVAFDVTGKVFAVAINERATILLYDSRKFDQSPFLSIPLNDEAALSMISMPPRVPIITSLSFSGDGKYLLIGTSSDVHYVVDTFQDQQSLQVTARLIGHSGLEHATGKPIGMVAEAGISGQELCWSPDGKWILGGSSDGSICFWYMDAEVAAKNEFRNLKPSFKQPGHDGASRALAFNPRLAQFASAGSEVAFWLPDQPDDMS